MSNLLFLQPKEQIELPGTKGFAKLHRFMFSILGLPWRSMYFYHHFPEEEWVLETE